MKRSLTLHGALIALVGGGCPTPQTPLPGNSNVNENSPVNNGNGNHDPNTPSVSQDLPCAEIEFPQGALTPPTGFFEHSQTLSFDTFADETVVTSQYRDPHGVLFSTVGTGSARAQARGDSGWGSDAISAPNSLAIADSDTLVVRFVYADRRPTKVGFVLVDATPSNTVTLTALNAQNEVVAMNSFDVETDSDARSTSNREDRFIAICASEKISTLEIQIAVVNTSTLRGWEIDNFVLGE